MALGKTMLLVASLALLPSCATQANKDPLEGMNRGIYKFNDVADKVLIKPVASAYQTVAPSPVRKGVNNFFDNLGSITTVFNDLLQFKFLINHKYYDQIHIISDQTIQ